MIFHSCSLPESLVPTLVWPHNINTGMVRNLGKLNVGYFKLICYVKIFKHIYFTENNKIKLLAVNYYQIKLIL